MIQLLVGSTLATLTGTAWASEDPFLVARLGRFPIDAGATEFAHALKVARELGAQVVTIDRPSSDEVIAPPSVGMAPAEDPPPADEPDDPFGPAADGGASQ